MNKLLQSLQLTSQEQKALKKFEKDPLSLRNEGELGEKEQDKLNEIMKNAKVSELERKSKFAREAYKQRAEIIRKKQKEKMIKTRRRNALTSAFANNIAFGGALSEARQMKVRRFEGSNTNKA